MAGHAIVDPGERDDKAWGTDTSNVQADQDSRLVAVRQSNDENRANNVGDKPSCSDVTPVVGPSLEGQRARPDCHDFNLFSIL